MSKARQHVHLDDEVVDPRRRSFVGVSPPHPHYDCPYKQYRRRLRQDKSRSCLCISDVVSANAVDVRVHNFQRRDRRAVGGLLGLDDLQASMASASLMFCGSKNCAGSSLDEAVKSRRSAVAVVVSGD